VKLKLRRTKMRSRMLAVLVVMASLLAPVYAGTLAVPLIGQERDNWCWDASSNMILQYYGFTHTQTEVAAWGVGGYNVGNHLSGTTIGPLLADAADPNSTYMRKGCGLVLTQFGPVDSSFLARALTMDEVSEEIDGGRPAMIAVRWVKAGKDVGGHAIVLCGYDESVGELITLHDPWPADNNVHGAGTPGVVYEVAYDDMFTAPGTGTYSDASAAIGNRWAQTLKTLGGLDICFLIDSTGSMGDDIDAVKAASLAMIDSLMVGHGSTRIAVVDYRDNPACSYCADYGDWITKVDTAFTTDASVARAAINSIYVGGGNDTPEAVFSALMFTMQDTIGLGGWRKDAERHIILMGDAPGHDPEPWDGGYSYADVLAYCAAEPNKIAIDALLTGSYGYDATASTEFSGFASASGGIKRTTADGNAGDVMTDIVTTITSPRAPSGNVAIVKPVFTFTTPTESMGPLVKNVLLEIQKFNVNKVPEKSAWKKFMLLKLAGDANSWTPPKPLPKGDYRWRTGYVRGAGTFTLPSFETRTIAAATLMEPNWTTFTRTDMAATIPTMVSPTTSPSSSFTAYDKEVDYIFTPVAGADSYALGISTWKETKGVGAWKLWKKLTVKPSAVDPNTGQINVTVKGHTLNGSYEWSVQSLNYDHPKPDPNLYPSH
jgi:hypothetical protein